MRHLLGVLRSRCLLGPSSPRPLTLPSPQRGEGAGSADDRDDDTRSSRLASSWLGIVCAIILAQNARPRAERSPMAKVKRAAAEPVAAAPGQPDWIVVVLALVGLGIAGYLTALKLGGNQAFLCRDGSGCDIVQASRYSLLAGVPTALWGAALYVAIAVLAALPRTVRRWQVTFMLVSAAVAFSIYLAYLSVFEIHATCPYCLASGLVAVALLVVMVLRRPRHGKEAAGYRPGKLVGLGITAGAFAVFLGAFIFAADFSTPAGYQMALAQHLKSSNAIFYGAFW